MSSFKTQWQNKLKKVFCYFLKELSERKQCSLQHVNLTPYNGRPIT